MSGDLRRSLRRFVEASEIFLAYRKRVTLRELRQIDSQLTNQWWGVNGTKTVSSGLAIASFVCLFAAPPVGIALGIGSAATGAGAGLGDLVMDEIQKIKFEDMADEDESKLQDFLQAAQEFHEVVLNHLQRPRSGLSESVRNLGSFASGTISTVFDIQKLVRLGELASTISKGSNAVIDFTMDGAAVTSNASMGGAGISVVAPVGVKVLGGAGMVFSVADSVRSWVYSKELQKHVRETIEKTEKSVNDLESQLLRALAEHLHD